jgi:hypothetical protein
MLKSMLVSDLFPRARMEDVDDVVDFFLQVLACFLAFLCSNLPAEAFELPSTPSNGMFPEYRSCCVLGP